MFLCLMVFVGALILSSMGAYRVFIDWERRVRAERIQGTPARPPRLSWRGMIAIFAVLSFIIVVLRACSSVYWTDGHFSFWLFSVLLLFLASLLLPLGISVLLLGRRAARLIFCTSMVFLLGPCVLIQEVKMHDFQKAQRELPLISTYLEETRIGTGSYPRNLSGYEFTFPEIESCLYYAPSRNDRDSDDEILNDYRLGLFPRGKFGDQVVWFVRPGDLTLHAGID